MSFLDLLDHRFELWRGYETKVAGGDVKPDFGADPVAENVPLALWPLQTPGTDYGAGEIPNGQIGGFTIAGIDIRGADDESASLDVIAVTSGPEAGRRYRVLSTGHPGRRFGNAAHHTELVLEPYRGQLPPDVS